MTVTSWRFGQCPESVGVGQDHVARHQRDERHADRDERRERDRRDHRDQHDDDREREHPEWGGEHDIASQPCPFAGGLSGACRVGEERPHHDRVDQQRDGAPAGERREHPAQRTRRVDPDSNVEREEPESPADGRREEDRRNEELAGRPERVGQDDVAAAGHQPGQAVDPGERRPEQRRPGDRHPDPETDGGPAQRDEHDAPDDVGGDEPDRLVVEVDRRLAERTRQRDAFQGLGEVVVLFGRAGPVSP